jgi:hypothetical protein
MIIETQQIFIDTSPSHGSSQLTLMGPVIIHILKAKVLIMHITDHMHAYVQNIYA